MNIIVYQGTEDEVTFQKNCDHIDYLSFIKKDDISDFMICANCKCIIRIFYNNIDGVDFLNKNSYQGPLNNIFDVDDGFKFKFAEEYPFEMVLAKHKLNKIKQDFPVYKDDHLPDIQLTEPKIKRPIKKVGVKDIIIPMMLESINGGYYEIQAKTSMYGNLNNTTKGVSMSRFIQTLQKYLKRPIKYLMLCDILNDLRKNLEVSNVYIKFEFKMPINKKSPLSDNKFPVFYDCWFEGKIIDNEFKFYQGVKVQYASYCPCSAELCHHLNEHEIGGYPHNQRGFCQTVIKCDGGNLWLEEIIKMIEKAVVNIPYPILKRRDEQEIARIAYENPMFVEDSIRAIANEFDSNEKIKDWYIMVDHEESIHHSNAVAIDYKGIDGGFNDKLYL